MIRVFLFLFSFSSFYASAQLPETVVYLIDMNRSVKGYSFSSPKIISKKIGYNNQPYFTPDEKYIYYVSSIDSANTEIYQYDLKKKKNKRLTKTREPEYSPRYSPDMNGISCVSVERDKTTQHLYIYNLKGKKPKVVMPELKTIGYYEWLSGIEFLSFELPEPFYFVRHNIVTGRIDTLANNIGRTFSYLRAKNKIVYIDKTDSLHYKFRFVAAENLKNKKKEPVENPILTETLPGEEDYCFMQDGSILMGHKGILYYKKNPFRHPNSTWDELVDLKKFGIDQFYRIAISPDNTKLAIVAFKGEKP
ncbi:MAG TPA: hypothetical protein PLU17_13600 [Chitinophagaceae bacterium]|nr:hypothetical protein [Chitinophagaceae bacterium]